MSGGKNRFNRITSKEWLPFQKSWFKYTDPTDWIRSNFRFFTTLEATSYQVFYQGPDLDIATREAKELGFEVINDLSDATEQIQFALIDLRSAVESLSFEEWNELKTKTLNTVSELFSLMVHRRFLMVAMPNLYIDGSYFPVAWDLANTIGMQYTLKDEKIACLEGDDVPVESDHFHPAKGHFYCLYFRKDERSGEHRMVHRDFFQRNSQPKLRVHADSEIPSWFILKPQRRNKKEVQHPAKYPEDLAEMFVQTFSQKGENVFDPMSGTGSTQISAVKFGRNGYGTELSSFFADIARDRVLSYIFQEVNAGRDQDVEADIIHADAFRAKELGFPKQHLLITSPPYWDMLNMKGAENQAKRIKKGLLTNYSDDDKDLGNVADYHDFIRKLTKLYFELIDMLVPGGIMVVVVKNIKKKGKNYPFAWDLGAILQEKMHLLPEVFWLQDDISIAPYGYGNTFVSNTFHQYCLIFQKPN